MVDDPGIWRYSHPYMFIQADPEPHFDGRGWRNGASGCQAETGSDFCFDGSYFVVGGALAPVHPCCLAVLVSEECGDGEPRPSLLGMRQPF